MAQQNPETFWCSDDPKLLECYLILKCLLTLCKNPGKEDKMNILYNIIQHMSVMYGICFRQERSTFGSIDQNCVHTILDLVYMN